MTNLVLITSVINTPHKPLSYSNIRSVFSRKERFVQTKKTIQSIKSYIPDSKIMIVECTDFNKEEDEYFKKECEFILNLWEREDLHNNIFGKSKSLGEGTMTIEALQWIINRKLMFDNFIKISGRYWLSETFDYNQFNNKQLIFKQINNDINNIFTALYKLPYNSINLLYKYLQMNVEKMKQNIGYEVLFGFFLKNLRYNNTYFVNIIGLQGYVTINGDKYDG